MQDEEYALSAPVQEKVRAVLRDMVYARTAEVFATQQWLLDSLLSHECPAFLEYMATRWYPHRRMWSDCERGSVFTAKLMLKWVFGYITQAGTRCGSISAVQFWAVQVREAERDEHSR